MKNFKYSNNTQIPNKGNSYFYASGPIKDHECAPGRVIISEFDINYDCDACASKRGLTVQYGSRASIEIIGGKRQSKCYGSTRIFYSPGVKNYAIL